MSSPAGNLEKRYLINFRQVRVIVLQSRRVNGQVFELQTWFLRQTWRHKALSFSGGSQLTSAFDRRRACNYSPRCVVHCLVLRAVVTDPLCVVKLWFVCWAVLSLFVPLVRNGPVKQWSVILIFFYLRTTFVMFLFVFALTRTNYGNRIISTVNVQRYRQKTPANNKKTKQSVNVMSVYRIVQNWTFIYQK